tara:strand:+ start:935 stop:1423 length:489 start_codon:yes stop_codon:yes gene_type:complete
MSKPLILGDEIYNYPTTGEINYGEEATGWAEDATKILGEVSGPGDIPTTEVTLVGTDDGTHINGVVTNMLFDTAFVQSMDITGFITRTYTDATPTQVEEFSIKGVYNGTDILFSVDYTGDDAELEFSTVGGQFNFKYLKITATDQVTIKYSAKAKIDESFFA